MAEGLVGVMVVGERFMSSLVLFVRGCHLLVTVDDWIIHHVRDLAFFACNYRRPGVWTHTRSNWMVECV